MIRFCPFAEINALKWDNTIQQSCFPTIFATYDILTCLTEGSKWNALIMDDYDYVMPLPERSKLGLHYVYSPFFVSQLGIFSKQETSAAITSDFFNAIPADYLQIDLLFNISNDTSTIDPYTISLLSHDLDLQTPYSELYTHFSQNTKRNIKSARKQNLHLIENGNIDSVIDLFCQNKGKEKVVNFKKRDYQILRKTAELLRSMQRLEVLEVHTVEDKCIAGALFVKDYQRSWFWFSGRNNQYSASKPMFFLLDEYVKAHAEQPFILDFNGSMNENVARLYTGFGGQPYSIKMLNYMQHTRWDMLIRLYKRIRHG